MHRAGVSAQREPGMTDDMRKLLETRPAHEVHRRNLCGGFDFCREACIEHSAADDDRDELLTVQPVAERSEIFGRPAFVRPVRADGQHDIRVGHIRSGLLHDACREVFIPRRDVHGEHDLVHTAAQFACRIEIALDDMTLRVRTDDRTAYLVAAFAHIAGTKPHGRLGQIRNGRRFEKSLQVKRRIVLILLQPAFERPKIRQEPAQGFEFLFFK